MKKLFCLSVFLVLVFASSGFCQDKAYDTYGIYLGLVGGYVIPTDESAKLTFPAGTVFNLDPELKNGFLYGAKIGWLTPFTKRILAVELEFNRLQNKFDSVNDPILLNGDMSGKAAINLFMLNLLVRKPDGRFHPYVGAGAGYADIKVSDIIINTITAPVPVSLSAGSDGVFAYQVMAGIDIDITKNFFLGMGYKYISPQKISYDTILTAVGPIMSTMKLDYSSHNFVLNIGYLF
jgi:opacity protein-like surface antigen